MAGDLVTREKDWEREEGRVKRFWARAVHLLACSGTRWSPPPPWLVGVLATGPPPPPLTRATRQSRVRTRGSQLPADSDRASNYKLLLLFLSLSLSLPPPLSLTPLPTTILSLSSVVIPSSTIWLLYSSLVSRAGGGNVPSGSVFFMFRCRTSMEIASKNSRSQRWGATKYTELPHDGNSWSRPRNRAQLLLVRRVSREKGLTWVEAFRSKNIDIDNPVERNSQEMSPRVEKWRKWDWRKGTCWSVHWNRDRRGVSYETTGTGGFFGGD